MRSLADTEKTSTGQEVLSGSSCLFHLQMDAIQGEAGV